MTRPPDPDDSLGFNPADQGKLAEWFDSGQNLPGPLGDGGSGIRPPSPDEGRSR